MKETYLGFFLSLKFHHVCAEPLPQLAKPSARFSEPSTDVCGSEGSSRSEWDKGLMRSISGGGGTVLSSAYQSGRSGGREGLGVVEMVGHGL